MNEVLKHTFEKRVLLVESDVFLSKRLNNCFFDSNYYIDSIPQGLDIPKTLLKGHFNIVILSDTSYEGDKHYWLKWIRQYYPHIIVVMTSIETDQISRLEALENGARDYLIKPFKNKELLIRLKNIFNTMKTPNKENLSIGNTVLNIKNNTITNKDKDKDIRLTGIEANILKLLYINAGFTMSRDEIMMQLRGVEHNPLDRSIDIHINKLRKKIENEPSKPSYIKTIRGRGYCLTLP